LPAALAGAAGIGAGGGWIRPGGEDQPL